jgi:hypothetical protein
MQSFSSQLYDFRQALGVIAEIDLNHGGSFVGDESNKSFFYRGKTTLRFPGDSPLPINASNAHSLK